MIAWPRPAEVLTRSPKSIRAATFRFTTVTPAAATDITPRPARVAFTLRCPKAARSPANNDSKTGAVTLGGLAVTLTQN